MIGNKVAKRITKVLKCSQNNNSETVATENDKEVPKEKYTPPEERQKIVDDLRLVYNSIITEYQKIRNLLDHTPNQISKSRTKNWVEINNDARGTFNTNNQTKFKTSMLK